MDVDSSDVSDHVLSDSGQPEDEPATFEKYPINIPVDVSFFYIKKNLVFSQNY